MTRQYCSRLSLLALLLAAASESSSRAQICSCEESLNAMGNCLNDGQTERFTQVGYRGLGILPSLSSTTADITSNANCVITANQIQQAPYFVRPNDDGDDSVGLQAAIDYIRRNCQGSASFRQRSLVELPAGTIHIDREIRLDADHLVLRGQGSDPAGGTKIEFRPGSDTVYDDDMRDFRLADMRAEEGANGGWIWPGRGALRVQTREVHQDYREAYEDAASNRKDFYEGSVNFHWKNGLEIAQTACRGSTEIQLAKGGSGIVAGDHIWVGSANSENMFDEQGVEDDDRRCGHSKFA